MALAAMVYLLACMPVTVCASFFIDGMQGAARLRVEALCVRLEWDWTLRLTPKPAARARYGRKERKRGGKGGADALRAALSLWRRDPGARGEVAVRLGLPGARETALAVGGARAALLALLSPLGARGRVHWLVEPDFFSPGLLACGRCIFAVTPGDISIAAIKAAASKLRKEGATWHSIPSRA